MEILISVIIPVYNGEKYISRAIDSLLNQSYKYIEIIVINDGSNDTTDEIVKSYGKQVRYYYQENKGVSSARNLGIENAKGTHIGFLDADDYVLPNMYAILLNDIQKHDSDFAVCNVFLENDQNLRVKTFQLNNVKLDTSKSKDLKKAFKYIGNSSCNKLFKKTIIKDIRFPRYKRGEDALFILEVLLNSKIISINNQALYVYYQNNASVTKSGIDLEVIDNYIAVHNQKRILIRKHNKDSILSSVLEDYYVKTFLMYTNSIRQIIGINNKKQIWLKWKEINKSDFVKNTRLKPILKISSNINWVYYSGMIVSGKFIKPILDRIRNFKYFFNT